MKIISFEHQIDARLAPLLAKFERQFSYPLGQTRRFHISHGDDYSRFFRAMGRARCFVAESNGNVVGSLAVVIRSISMPEGSDREVAYLADLKIAPHARGGWTLLRLGEQARIWVGRSLPAYGVVMDGTEATPDRYTGRAGLPPFEPLAKVMVMRFAVPDRADRIPEVANASAPDVATVFRKLSAKRCASSHGNPAERSSAVPAWLLHKEGLACGCLENTQRAKRLFLDDGSEMLSAHLSCFAYSDVHSGASVIREAIARARQLGFPALFLAVDAADSSRLLAELDPTRPTLAPATVYGLGLPGGISWNINSAEI